MALEAMTIGVSHSLIGQVKQVADYIGVSVEELIDTAAYKEYDIERLSESVTGYLVRHSLPPLSSVLAECRMSIFVVEDVDPNRPLLSTKIINIKLLLALMEFEADPRNAKHVKNLGWG